MRLTLRRLSLLIIVLYALFTIYAGYYLFLKHDTIKEEEDSAKYESILTEGDSHQAPHVVDDGSVWNPWAEGASKPSNSLPRPAALNKPPADASKYVEIWGKAAIGHYLWEHIFNGILEDDSSGLLRSSSMTHNGIRFRFRTGPGLIQSTAPGDVTHLVLVLNGRSDQKIKFARAWLDHLPQLASLRRTAVVLLGSEKCDNDWLHAYARRRGGPVDLVFVVYDSRQTDGNTVFQWPLGVATYRNFPVEALSDAAADSARPFRCNFAGTVYANSSRTEMMRVLDQAEFAGQCVVKPRYKWLNLETQASMEAYADMLEKSDLTLCPVGVNTECYRIYEAMALGSVPVVEDVSTAGQCASTPLRLLKELKAPVVYVKHWRELGSLLRKEMEMSDGEKRVRRRRLLKWYQWFKQTIRDRFLSVIDRTFFSGQ